MYMFLQIPILRKYNNRISGVTNVSTSSLQANKDKSETSKINRKSKEVVYGLTSVLRITCDVCLGSSGSSVSASLGSLQTAAALRHEPVPAGGAASPHIAVQMPGRPPHASIRIPHLVTTARCQHNSLSLLNSISRS